MPAAGGVGRVRGTSSLGAEHAPGPNAAQGAAEGLVRLAKCRTNEKLRVRQSEVPEFPIRGPSNMRQRSARACVSILARRVPRGNDIERGALDR